jgi:hypothetical protein
MRVLDHFQVVEQADRHAGQANGRAFDGLDRHVKKIGKTVKKGPASSKRISHAGQWRDFGESRVKDERGLT